MVGAQFSSLTDIFLQLCDRWRATFTAPAIMPFKLLNLVIIPSHVPVGASLAGPLGADVLDPTGPPQGRSLPPRIPQRRPRISARCVPCLYHRTSQKISSYQGQHRDNHPTLIVLALPPPK